MDSLLSRELFGVRLDKEGFLTTDYFISRGIRELIALLTLALRPIGRRRSLESAVNLCGILDMESLNSESSGRRMFTGSDHYMPRLD